jgi:hypothetical protein
LLSSRYIFTYCKVRYEILFDESRNRATNAARKGLLARIEEWTESGETFLPVPEKLAGDTYKDVATALIYLPSNLLPSEIKKDNLGHLLQQEVDLRVAYLHGLRSGIRGAVKAVNSAEKSKASTAKGQRPNTKANDQIRTLDRLRDSLVNTHNEAFDRLVQIGKRMGKDYHHGFQHLEAKDLCRKWTMGGRQVGDSRRCDGSLWTGAGRVNISSGPSGGLSSVADDEDEESTGNVECLVIEYC